MMLEDAPTPEDRVLDVSGIKVYVDGQSVDLLSGLADRLRRHADGRRLHGQQPERRRRLRLRLELPDRRRRWRAEGLLALTTAGRDGRAPRSTIQEPPGDRRLRPFWRQPDAGPSCADRQDHRGRSRSPRSGLDSRFGGRPGHPSHTEARGEGRCRSRSSRCTRSSVRASSCRSTSSRIATAR